MKTKVELEQDIIDTTTIIHQKFPELSKYLAEIPVGLNNEDVNVRNLQDYYRTLEELIANYANTHATDLGDDNHDD